jgi:Raf kinase inhibitor-like YbhB/YbcL family protein
MSFQLSSSAFREGQVIPTIYTADGDDHSPPLAWSGQPSETASLALICEDPDAPRGTWVHWVLYNLPSDLRELPAHISSEGTLASGARQGKNDFGKLGYGGPSPPRGKPHRYFFRIYALDVILENPVGVSKERLLATMQGHVLAEAHLMGKYQR